MAECSTTRIERWSANWTSGRSRTARACRWTSSNPCRWTCRRCCRWNASPPCRPPAAVRGRARFATFPSSTKGSGVRAARSTSWRSSSISRHSATARSILSMTIFFYSQNGSRPSVQALTTMASRFNGAVKAAWTPSPSTCFQRWPKPTVARSCSESRAAARRYSIGSEKSRRWQSLRLLRRFLRYMPLRDVVYLIIKPFLGKRKGATKAEVLSRAVEHGAIKDAAAELTQVNDDVLEHVLKESQIERLRIQQEAEGQLPV